MLRMIILWIGILEVTLLINSMIVVIVIEWIYFICLPSRGLPDLVGKLQLFTLLYCRVWVLGITLKSSVADYFVNHLEVIKKEIKL